MDLRHADKAELDAMEAALRKTCTQFEKSSGVRIEIIA